LPPPPLELFDLDDEWAGAAGRLAVLTNKCTDDDLEYYVRQAGDLLGICDFLDRQSSEGADVRDGYIKDAKSTNGGEYDGGQSNVGMMSTGRWSGKEILACVLRQLVDYKKVEQESDDEEELDRSRRYGQHQDDTFFHDSRQSTQTYHALDQT
jgi:hypothetical protein